MTTLTVQGLLTYLDSVQRAFGADIPCYLVAPAALLPQARGMATLAPLVEVTTQHGQDGSVALLLSGAGPWTREVR